MLKSFKRKVDFLKENYFYPALSKLEGKVLEIGFGDGESFNHYNPHCQIFALEKSEEKIQQLKNKDYLNIKFFKGEAEMLPFDDNFFDAVVVSLVLCSVDSLEKAIMEIERVLKPGGKFIMLEHTRSKTKIIGKLEDIFSKPHAWLFENCHLNRDPLLFITKKENLTLMVKKELPYIFGRVMFATVQKTMGGKPSD